MSQRIAQKFQTLKSRGEKALIPYLMAGDPDPQRARDYFLALIRGGGDLIEIGVPFSDPVADGPVIQAAGARAQTAHTTWETVFDLVESLRLQTDIPLVLMSYYNPIFAYGESKFVERCKAVGVDGLIVPDLPVEESASLNELAQKAEVDLIFLATPETPEGRLQQLAAASRGFLYVVSRYGVTGAQHALSEATTALVQKVRRTVSELPLVVGFGLSTPDHVRTVLQAGADGAVVGSALVNEVGRGVPPDTLHYRVRDLKAVTRSTAPAPPADRV